VVAAVTVTEATTADVVTSVALAVLPSTLPVIDTVPAPTAVTTPRFETVAMLVFELLHVTVRPVSTLPDASVATAVACAVLPTGIVDLSSTTLRLAIVDPPTVSVAEPETPSTVAVILVVPVSTAAIRPSEETVATDGLALAHVTVLPEIWWPAESYAIAAACVVCPI